MAFAAAAAAAVAVQLAAAAAAAAQPAAKHNHLWLRFDTCRPQAKAHRICRSSPQPNSKFNSLPKFKTFTPAQRDAKPPPVFYGKHTSSTLASLRCLRRAFSSLRNSPFTHRNLRASRNPSILSKESFRFQDLYRVEKPTPQSADAF